jgi:CheY-like chemotaxis protein
MKILLASPSLDECRIIQSLLGPWQHELSIVRSGQLALGKLLHETPPALALLDAALPGMDGFSLCRWIRGHLASRPPHVVILGDRTDRLMQQYAAGAGASALLGKPLSEAALKEQFALSEIAQQLHLRAMQRLSLATTQRMAS